jgi:short-subunit dehydrogenase involved in D-alanine esterification of teichoic acids
MAARINTILVIGGTAGIGEQIARRFHSLGKQVIITGRSEAKLDALAKELSGLETRKVFRKRKKVAVIKPKSGKLTSSLHGSSTWLISPHFRAT